MRQIFLDKKLITINEVCKPTLNQNSILVSVHYSFISPETEALLLNQQLETLFGNVIKNLAKTLDSLAYTNIINQKSSLNKSLIQALGYSCCGQVISTGKNVKNFRPGDYVACMGIGIAHHADFVCVPEDHAIKINNTDILPQSSTIALGTKAAEIFLQSGASLGDIVCIVGLDFLGLLIMQLAAAAGCQVIGLDYTDQKLASAQKLGPFKLYKLSDQSLVDNVLHYTHGHGASSIFITHEIHAADEKKICSIVCDKGKIIITDTTHFKFTDCCPEKKEISMVLTKKFSYPSAHQEHSEYMKIFINLLEQHKINIDPLIDQYTTLERVNHAYEKLKNPATTGIILSYLPKAAEHVEINREQLAEKISNHDIGVALIGVDHYTKHELLPLITKINNLKLKAIIDSDVTQSLEISKKYQHAKILSNEQELLNEDLCHAIILNATDSYEGDKIIDLLSAGKALLIQNSMAHNPEQFKKLKNFLHQNPTSKFCINYKRSFSPFMQKIKEATQKRNTPLMIHYRLNDSFDKNNTTQRHDAGKIINQASHVIDLFCFLTEAQPTAISVESLNPSHDKIFPTDNFCAHISFNDGSVCSIMFTGIGHHGCGQERMEIFFDSKTIIMNDFISLIGYGLPKSFNEKVFSPDHGQEQILRQFFKTIAEDQQPPIPFDRLCTVADITLAIDQLACQGGGIQ